MRRCQWCNQLIRQRLDRAWYHATSGQPHCAWQDTGEGFSGHPTRYAEPIEIIREEDPGG